MPRRSFPYLGQHSPLLVLSYFSFLLALLICIFWLSREPVTRTRHATAKPEAYESGVGYLPFKALEPSWGLASGGAANISKRGEQGVKVQSSSSTSTGTPTCATGRVSCQPLGHPVSHSNCYWNTGLDYLLRWPGGFSLADVRVEEICCLEGYTCLSTNHSTPGVFCCPNTTSPDAHCDDNSLSCPFGSYECPPSVNGGCCPYDSRCGLQECVSGNGPPSPYTPLLTPTQKYEAGTTVPYSPGIADPASYDVNGSSQANSPNGMIATDTKDPRVVNSLTSTGVVAGGTPGNMARKSGVTPAQTAVSKGFRSITSISIFTVLTVYGFWMLGRMLHSVRNW